MSIGQLVTVYAGNKSARCRVSRGAELFSDLKVASLSEKLAQRLSIPVGPRLNVARIGDKLKIGPLIGVLTKQSKDGTFKQDSFYRKLMAQLKKQNCLGMVFTLNSIDWKSQTIEGYWLPNNGSTQWKRRRFPFPDVCYNRYFRNDSDPWSYPILQRMSKSGVKSFNAPMGSKLRIHSWLNQEKEIHNHLPDTEVLTGIGTLQRMIQKHGQVYIKPTGGCQGRGITRVRKVNGTLFYQGTKDNQEHKYNEISRVYHRIKTSTKAKVMLIQQGITCPNKASHFDVRAMVQKDGNNVWQITGLAGRLGAKGHITTNLHTGGKAINLGELLQSCGFSGEKTHSIISQINSLALRIADSIESHVNPVGEMGLDFILDKQGNVWFLEANSKPGRKSFSNMESNSENRLTIARPMLYARYLAGF